MKPIFGNWPIGNTESGGDKEDHDYYILLGNWFAKCKAREES